MSRVPALRPKLSWSDLAGARVGVWGLGREGHANLRKLRALGVEPVLVDDQPPGLVDGRPVLATGDGGLAGLGYTCMLGGNIGAPPYDPAEDGDFDYWVIEVSSYQATDLPCSPPVV